MMSSNMCRAVSCLLLLLAITGHIVAEDGRNCEVKDKTGLPQDVCTFDLKMKGAKPETSDQYFCSGYKVSTILGVQDTDPEGYIVRYEALADANTAHHILVFGCARLRRRPDEVWNCGQVCDGDDQIIFAWAKNAPPLTLPKDVGQHVGGRTTNINFIVVQIHYVNPLPEPDYSGIRVYMTQQRQLYISGIYLLLNYGITIPADTPKFHVDSSCRFDWKDSIVPFGFRTHAHSLSRVISGYKVKDGQYELIGKGNPQWPQAFYPVENSVVINPGDILAARCTYNSTGRFRGTQIGSTANDEMCNFYIMYYINSSMEANRGKDTCFRNVEGQVFQNLPSDADTPLPSNPALDAVAMGHHHHNTGGDDDGDHEKTNRPQIITGPSQVDLHGNQPPQTQANAGEPKLHSELGLQFVSEVANIQIGQVGGLGVSSEGDLYIFHRGSNIWTALSFSPTNVYQYRNLPVDVDPIIVLSKDGALKKHFGKNRYYLPHGLSLDKDDNLWLTDVALHQVFRIPKGAEEPDMTLGIQFEPGSDLNHFCKPADVAVMSTGEFFVADGYCNYRVVKFDKNGYYMKEWGTRSASFGLDNIPPPGTFNLPHGVALAEDKGLVCVADRENGRIQCFDLNGSFVRQMHPKLFGTELFAVEYCPNHGGILFAVNGPLFGPKSEKTQGFTLDINTGDLLSTWNIPGQGLTHPHDVTVDSKDHVVYVGELNPRKVWKFQMTKALYTTNSSEESSKVNSPTSPLATSKKVTKGMTLKTSTMSVVMETKSKIPPVVVSPSSNDSTTSPISPLANSKKVTKGMTLKTSTMSVVMETKSKIAPVVVSPSSNDSTMSSSTEGVEFSTDTVTTESTSTELPVETVTEYSQNVNNLDLFSIDNHENENSLDSPYIVPTDTDMVSEVSVEFINYENVDSPLSEKEEAEADSFGPSVIIGALLVVPVLLLIIITVTIRLYQSGRCKGCRKRGGTKSVFSLGSFLQPHKGFDRLSTEDDDHDFDNVLTDSDNEEFNITRKA